MLEAVSIEESGERTSSAVLVLGTADAPELQRIAGGYHDGSGQEWSEYALGALTVRGDTVTIEVTLIDAVPACPGCDSDEEDFGEVSRTEHPSRVTCAPRAADDDDDDGDEDAGAWACERSNPRAR